MNAIAVLVHWDGKPMVQALLAVVNIATLPKAA